MDLVQMKYQELLRILQSADDDMRRDLKKMDDDNIELEQKLKRSEKKQSGLKDKLTILKKENLLQKKAIKRVDQQFKDYGEICSAFVKKTAFQGFGTKVLD